MRISGRPAGLALGAAIAGITGLGAPTAAIAQPTPSTPDKWGVIDRNTIGSPSATLRYGPYGRTTEDPAARQRPPYGQGSLGLLVGDGSEKIMFGNETSFEGLRLADMDDLSYWVYVGMDDITGVGLPHISMEVDPNLPGVSDYSSLNYLPNASAAPSAPETPANNVWQHYNATAEGNAWFATGGAGTAIGCTNGDPCTFEELQAALPDAQVTFSVGINKGRDTPFAGAVDGLRINNLVYDFERTGVLMKYPIPAYPS